MADAPRPCHARAIFHRVTVSLTKGDTYTVRALRPLLSALLICVSAGLCIMATQGSRLPPTMQNDKTDHVLYMATHDGIAQTATALSRPHGWDDVMQALARGRPEAARIVATVMPQTDARTARTLEHTLQRLLPRQPAMVLSATEPNAAATGSTRNICSPTGMSTTWRKQAERAVTKLHDIRLATRTQTCLHTLQRRAPSA
ncbi:hypothetical protein PY793_00145 [Acetobacter fabarum]|uniref:hypothetical protein n=1 Tax=Acetobacter fabarum TaxID=483199 RepID=UPI00312B72E3